MFRAVEVKWEGVAATRTYSLFQGACLVFASEGGRPMDAVRAGQVAQARNKAKLARREGSMRGLAT